MNNFEATNNVELERIKRIKNPTRQTKIQCSSYGREMYIKAD